MFEPYPYQINKAKVALLAIVAPVLIAGLVLLRLNYVEMSVAGHYVESLRFVSSLLQIIIIFFCFKAYSLKYSRDYLFIGAGLLLAFLLQMFNQFAISQLELSPVHKAAYSSFQIDHLVLSIYLLLATYHAGKAQPLKRKGLRLFFTVSLSLIILALIIWFLLYFIIPRFNISQLRLPLVFVSIAILLWAEFKLIKIYRKKSYNIYFWFITALLFLIFAPLYRLLNQDLSLFISHFSMLGAYFAFIWATYEEHTRFMESEIDIRKSLEKSLLQVEDNLTTYRELVDQVDVGIFVIDEEGSVTFANNRLGQMLGISAKRLIGRKQETLFDEKNLEKLMIEREKWIAGLKSQFEIEILNRRGKNIPVLISAVPIKNRRGQFKGSRNVVIKITAWKEFEKKIKEYSSDLEKKIQERTQDLNRKSEEWKRAKTYYESLISGMLDILLVVDKQGNCIFINDYGKKLLGYEAKELKRRMLPNFFADMKNLQQSYGDSMKIELRDYEAELKTKSGKKILCSWNVRYMFDHTGKNIGAMCVGRDISEYKMLQEKLKAHSKNLEQEVALRTQELKAKVDQLAKILKVGEDIILNINLPVILSNICNAIKSMGWKIVIIALKEEDVPYSKIAAFKGIQQNRLRKFMAQRENLFKNTLKFLRDEYRVGKSYFLDMEIVTRANFITHGIERPKKLSGKWQDGDVLLSPIKIKSKILGFIMTFEPEDGLRPDEEKTQIVEIFAQKAAVAIENNHLFKEIEARVKEIEKANKMKSEFFANMSHELRTPLNSILTLTSILLQKMTGELNREQLHQIAIIKRNGERLLKLINDILDLSKIEAGRMEINYSYFPIIDLIKANAETIRPLALKKRLKLEMRVDKKVPQYIFNDKEKIDLVLTNILSNAVKFTNKGKITISVGSNSEGNQLTIRVKDTGIGIDKSELQYIFHPFRQSKDQEGAQKGTGLGLSIAQQLWSMLGGNISVESKKGEGTLFQLQLPLKEVGEEQKKMVQQKAVAEKQKIVPASGGRSAANRKKQILLVDDNLDNQYAVKFILEDRGYRVLFARNGAEGIKMAIKAKPALILMDMMMPGIDGYQAAKKIRTNRDLRRVPIVAMTAKTREEDRGRALNAGCSDYLSKPFSLEDMINKVEKWIGKAK